MRTNLALAKRRSLGAWIELRAATWGHLGLAGERAPADIQQERIPCGHHSKPQSGRPIWDKPAGSSMTPAKVFLNPAALRELESRGDRHVALRLKCMAVRFIRTYTIRAACAMIRSAQIHHVYNACGRTPNAMDNALGASPIKRAAKPGLTWPACSRERQRTTPTACRRPCSRCGLRRRTYRWPAACLRDAQPGRTQSRRGRHRCEPPCDQPR